MVVQRIGVNNSRNSDKKWLVYMKDSNHSTSVKTKTKNGRRMIPMKDLKAKGKCELMWSLKSSHWSVTQNPYGIIAEENVRNSKVMVRVKHEWLVWKNSEKRNWERLWRLPRQSKKPLWWIWNLLFCIIMKKLFVTKVMATKNKNMNWWWSWRMKWTWIYAAQKLNFHQSARKLAKT